MSLAYALAYRFGITPWEKAGESAREQFEDLLEREQEGAAAHERALDLGCGRGLHSIRLAERGWEVTGVDAEVRAITAAVDRAAEAGQKINFLVGDVTDLPAEVGTGYRFVLDVGCFHGLSPAQRRRFGEQVDAVTVPGATMLMMAFSPGGRGPLPRGAGHDELAEALPQWSVLEQHPAQTSGMPAPLRSRNPQFYRLRKH